MEKDRVGSLSCIKRRTLYKISKESKLRREKEVRIRVVKVLNHKKNKRERRGGWGSGEKNLSYLFWRIKRGEDLTFRKGWSIEKNHQKRD